MHRLGRLLLLVCMPVAAVEVTHCTVEKADNSWSAALVAEFDASPAEVFAAITDYDNLQAINPSIRRSRVIGELPENGRRVDMLVRVCILVFCKDIRRVQDVYPAGDSTVKAQMVAGAGDFLSGAATWRVTAAGAGARLEYRETFRPGFWVPPVIGPWLIKHKLIDEVAVIGKYLERGTGE